VILAASHFGYPLSTTHVISGAVMGSGAAKRLSAVRWGVAGNMIGAWLVTLPAAGAMGGLAYAVTRIFGANNAAGPVVVLALLLSAIALAFVRRGRRATPRVVAGAEA
jgi:inorganic phosphate transporter, PiT family